MTNMRNTADENEFSPVGYEIRLREKQQRTKHKHWVNVGGLIDDYGQSHDDIELELPEGFYWGTPWRMPHAGNSGDDLGWQYGNNWATTKWKKTETEHTPVRKRLYVRKLGFNEDVKLTESIFQHMKALGVVHAKFVPDHAQDDHAHDNDDTTTPPHSSNTTQQHQDNNTHNDTTKHKHRSRTTSIDSRSRQGSKASIEQPHSLPALNTSSRDGVQASGPQDSDTTPRASDSEEDDHTDNDTQTFHDNAHHHDDTTASADTKQDGKVDTHSDADSGRRSTTSDRGDTNTEGELRIVETEEGTVAEYDEAIYENQRSGLVGGFSTNWLIPYVDKRGEWSNAEGEPVPSSEDFKIPNGWKWKADWVVDDWQYAFSFWDKVWASDATNGSFVRRRKWSRTRHMLLNDKKASVDVSQPPPINELPINGYVTACMVLVCSLLLSTSLVQLWIFSVMGNTITLLTPPDS